MLTKYQLSEQAPGFIEAEEEARACWWDLEDPCQEELSEATKSLNFPPSFLADPLDVRERPRIDQEDETLMLIIRMPVLSDDNQGPGFYTTPLGLIVKGDKLVTVCRRGEVAKKVVSRFFRKPRATSNVKILLKILIECSVDFMNHLELMEDITDAAEASLGKAQHNDQIMTLLTIDKALINYSVALKSNRSIVGKLTDVAILPLTPEEMDLLDYAMIENQQATYMADIFGQVLGSLGDAFGTIINNNLNKIMKLLTGVTIILMIPTLIVGAYGMNVALPLAVKDQAFWIILGISVVLSLLSFIIFWKKHWI
ncbi:MAG: magnesium transporter CorA family protein [Deltaproteobacteria bacterium]|jgi:magnesium transporter|nr:magnesium transporter CorA family protein [Deltaproteobacteria bacterium]